MPKRPLHASPSLAWIAIALLLIGAVAASLPAQDELEDQPSSSAQAEAPAEPAVPQERSSPRATMRTLLEAFERRDYRAAIETLDLSQEPIGEDLREVRGRELATQLKDAIDRIRYVRYEEIPDERTGPPYRFAEVEGHRIVIAPTPRGDWRFTPATVAAIPELTRALADRQRVAGAIEAPRTPALWLRSLVPERLRHPFFLLERWQWLGLALLVFVGFVLDRLIVWLVGRRIVRVLEGRNISVDVSALHEALRPAGLLVMAASWWLGLLWLGLPSRPLQILMVAVKFLAIVSLVWTAYKLVDVVTHTMAVRAARSANRLDDLLVPMVRKSAKVFIAAFGLVFLADNLHVDIAGLLAGLGLGGIAVALAAQDTLKNLFGSLTVLLDRPFGVDDWIVVGDVEGTVEEVGFRSTRVRTFYNSLITLPNASLVGVAVDNYGARRFRRWRTTVGIAYDTPPEQIDAFCEGLRELVRRHPYTRKDYFQIYLNEFGSHSLDVLLYVFFEVPDWGTELRERHRLAIDILRLASRLGVEIAFPTQTLYLRRAKQDGEEAAARALSYGEQVSSAVRRGREEARRLVETTQGERVQS